ncbi:hypothetical protein GCM10023083_01700 [Streptomyces phyllanthi]
MLELGVPLVDTAEIYGPEFADGKGVTPSQPAPAWLPAKKPCTVPTPGSHNPARVAQNIAAADLRLTATDLDRTAEIVPDGGIGGRLS